MSLCSVLKMYELEVKDSPEESNLVSISKTWFWDIDAALSTCTRAIGGADILSDIGEFTRSGCGCVETID